MCYASLLPPYEAEINVARQAVRAAGRVIRDYYDRGETASEPKADDSPLTAADLAANAAILDILSAQFPTDAILSEETEDDLQRVGQRRVWIVDPLDGTRDFVKRTGDFAVHVALVEEGRPVVGAVFQPVGEVLYHAAIGQGAFAEDVAGKRRLRASSTAELGQMRVGVTRFAVNPSLESFLAGSGLASNIVRIGASLKMMAVAAGEIDVTVCLNAAEKEWDTAAPEVILREAGAVITDIDGRPFDYNKRDVRHLRGILVSNGRCHAELVELVRPHFGSPS